MNDISSSTHFNNTTFIVDEIDIDTKRPNVDIRSNHHLVKQIKVTDSRSNQMKSNWITPTSIHSSNTAMRIKQRVLTPFHQDLSKVEHKTLNKCNLSTIVSSGETRII